MRTLEQPPEGYISDQAVEVFTRGVWVDARYSHTDKDGDIWARMEWTEHGRQVVVLDYFPPNRVRTRR